MSCYFLKALLLNFRRNTVETKAVLKRREISYREC